MLVDETAKTITFPLGDGEEEDVSFIKEKKSYQNVRSIKKFLKK